MQLLKEGSYLKGEVFCKGYTDSEMHNVVRTYEEVTVIMTSVPE